MLILAGIYVIFPHQLMELFRNDFADNTVPFSQIADYGATILFFVAVYNIFDAIIITFSGALRGAGDTVFAMWVAIICAWCIFVPGTWLALVTFNWGVFSAWIWVTFYLALLGVIFILRFRSGYWKSIKLIDTEGN